MPKPVMPSRRAGDALLALLFLVLVLVAYADPLLTRRNFVGRDIVPYDLPLEKAVHDAWARDQVPRWWTSVSGGRPLLPNPNAGVFYPVRPALSRVPFPVAMRLFPVFHWILGGWGMLLLLRVIGGSRAAAWISAVSFSFSGVIVSEVFYGVIHPGAALLPWTLWALARPASRPIHRVLPVALVYGLVLLAGDAFSLSLALLSAGLWIGLELPREERARNLVHCFAGLALAALVALPQVLATALLAPETRRMVGGITMGDAFLFTMPVARLFELIIPYPYGPSWEMNPSLDWGDAAFRRFFSTIFVGPIAIFGVLGAAGARGTRLTRWLIAITAALALSGHLIPASWQDLPSPIPLRYPEKFILGATFGLAIAAGLAVDALRRGQGRRTGLLAAAGALAAAAVLARIAPEAAGRLAMAAVDAPPRVAAVASQQVPAALADGGLLWVATAIAAALLSRPSRARLAGALLLLTAVPVAADRGIAQAAHEAMVFSPTPFARTLQRKDPEGAYRTLDESLYRPTAMREVARQTDPGETEFYRQSWFYYTHSLWGRGTVVNADLDAGDLSRVESLRRVAALAAAQSDSSPFFASLSLRYGIRYRHQVPVAGFEAFGGDALRAWDENPDALPHIRLVERWREERGPVEALAALPSLVPGEIVLETNRRVSGSARPGRVRILKETSESLELTTECPDPAWLFVLRGDWSYRSVLVDGRPAPAFPAQIAFSAVFVPAGEHRIDWREGAPGLEISRWGPVAAGLLLLGLGVIGRTA